MHASSVIASASRGRFCQHLVSVIDILVLYARITYCRLCSMQPLSHLALISITKAHISHQFRAVLSKFLVFDPSWVWGGVNRHVVHYIWTSCEACGSLYLDVHSFLILLSTCLYIYWCNPWWNHIQKFFLLQIIRDIASESRVYTRRCCRALSLWFD